MPNDTTTRLSKGAQDGDVFDESLITQAGDGVTQAKRARVVLGGDAQGAAIIDPVAADPGKNPYSLPALATTVVSDAPPSGYVDNEIRPLSSTTDGRLRVSCVAADVYLDMFGDTSPLSTETPDYASLKKNPYGM